MASDGVVYSAKIELNNTSSVLKALQNIKDTFQDYETAGSHASKMVNDYLGKLADSAKNAAQSLANVKLPKDLKDAAALQKQKNQLTEIAKNVDRLREAFKSPQMSSPLRKVLDFWSKIAKKIKESLSLSRLFYLTQLAGAAKQVAQKMFNFGNGVTSDQSVARATNSSVRNVRAFDYAADMWGMNIDKSNIAMLSEALSDSTKQGNLANLGLDVDKLKAMDGADAFVDALQSIDKSIRASGGYDDMGSQDIYKEALSALGVDWNTMKGAAVGNFTNEYQSRKAEDTRDYEGFGSFERSWKRLTQSFDDLWEGALQQLLPIFQSAVTKLRGFFKSAKGVFSQENIQKVKKFIDGIVDKLGSNDFDIDTILSKIIAFGEGVWSIVEFFSSGVKKLQAAWNSLLGGIDNFILGLYEGVRQIPIIGQALPEFKRAEEDTLLKKYGFNLEVNNNIDASTGKSVTTTKVTDSSGNLIQAAVNTNSGR